MTTNFVDGEVVQLRSGGPMAVVVNGGQTKIDIMYFNQVSGLMEVVKFIPAEALKLANLAPSIPTDATAMRTSSVTKSSLS